MALKITPEDYDTIKQAMAGVLALHPDAQAYYRQNNLSDKRFRWDVFRVTGLTIGDGAGAPGDLNLYAYLNDDHIDSALKQIVHELQSTAKSRTFCNHPERDVI